MRMFLFLGLFIFAVCCEGATWQADWAEALACSKEECDKAEELFDAAIMEMEKIGEQDFPAIYVDRGRFFFRLERDYEALEDFNTAVKKENLEDKDLVRAVSSRLFIFARSGDMKKWRVESDLLVKVMKDSKSSSFFKECLSIVADDWKEDFDKLFE